MIFGVASHFKVTNMNSPEEVDMALLPPQEHDHNPCSLGHLSTASSQGPWMVDLADCNWWNMRGQITCKIIIENFNLLWFNHLQGEEQGKRGHD